MDEGSAEVSDLKGTRGQTNSMLKLPGFSHDMCVKFMCHRKTLTFAAEVLCLLGKYKLLC